MFWTFLTFFEVIKSNFIS